MKPAEILTSPGHHQYPRKRLASFGRREGPSETFAPHRPFRARETLSRRPDRRNPAPHPAGNRGSLGDTRLDAGSRRTAGWKAKSPASFSLGNPPFYPGSSGIYRDLVGTQWNQGPAGRPRPATRGKPAFRQGRYPHLNCSIVVFSKFHRLTQMSHFHRIVPIRPDQIAQYSTIQKRVATRLPIQPQAPFGRAPVVRCGASASRLQGAVQHQGDFADSTSRSLLRPLCRTSGRTAAFMLSARYAAIPAVA